MTANATLERMTGQSWTRGLGPLLRRENGKWWGSRRWLVQLILWTVLIDGLLVVALYVLPSMTAADGAALSREEAYEAGRQMFFGLGVLALSIGAIILLQDTIIEEKATGTAEWVLSKPASRTAFIVAKLLPNLLGMAVTMLLVPGVIGYFIFRNFGADFTLGQFLTSGAIVALHLLFYVTLTLMLGVLFDTRPPLLGLALGSLFGGSLVPIASIVQFTPWKLADLVVLPVMGQPLPPIAATMLLSTVAWSVIFVAVAIWRFNRQEF